MYGTQTHPNDEGNRLMFENDVKMYGTQTVLHPNGFSIKFENDVKMYGTQTAKTAEKACGCLRMM